MSSGSVVKERRKEWQPGQVGNPGLLPTERLGVVEFAAQHLVVPEGRAVGQPLRLHPFQVGIINAIQTPAVEYTVVKCSSQVGKSTVALALIGHAIGERPCPVLYVAPTERPMGEAFARTRVDPLIRQSPRLAAKFRGTGTGGKGGKKLLSKEWEGGGALSIVGANSAKSLAARAIELLLLDEFDKYPVAPGRAGRSEDGTFRQLAAEGDIAKQAEQRTDTYGRRRRIVQLSTPAMAEGRIEAAHERGDRCEWWVRCPRCERRGPITWDDGEGFRIDWERGRAATDDAPAVEPRPETAAVVCPCGARWTERERLAAIAGGEWVPTCPASDARYRSFYIWAGSAPYARLSEIVREWEEAQLACAAGDFSKLRAWTQLKLGLAFDDSIIGDSLPEIQTLRAALVNRAGRDGDAPAELPRTAGFDVQANRVEGLIVGWGAGEESWIHERAEFAGDVADPADACWESCAEWLKERGVVRASIDSRYATDAVLSFAKATGAAATRGIEGGPVVQRPRMPDPPKVGRRALDRGARVLVPIWNVGTHAAKRLTMTRLAKSEPGPGFVHTPAWFEARDARQLVSEREIEVEDKHGRVRRVWEVVNRRNELLDMYVLALHARRRRLAA